MDGASVAFLFSLTAVVLAEMGDKTQLLAMAFAARYKALPVMIGVMIATVFNHGVAVAVGSYIAGLSWAQNWIQGLAAISFVFFGLWTLHGDTLNGEENRVGKFGPVVTVAIAFFIAEMGDKTQLATIALSAKFSVDPIFVLMGTTAGMLLADGIGVIVGVALGKKIPQRKVKLVSAAAFILFGFIGCYQLAVTQLHWPLPTVTIGMLAFMIVTLATARNLLRR